MRFVLQGALADEVAVGLGGEGEGRSRFRRQGLAGLLVVVVEGVQRQAGEAGGAGAGLLFGLLQAFAHLGGHLREGAAGLGEGVAVV